MAPEQCKGHPVDRRSDVFALGIVLYELTTVRRLFKASTDFLTMSKIVSGSVPKPSRYRPELPAELEQIALRALALDPRQRFQTADEMRIALDQFAIREGLRTSTTALGDYIIEMFGHRPEPWLVEPDEYSIVIEPAFDGSGDGVVPAPETIDEFPPSVSAQPGSPLDQARRRDTVDAELEGHAGAPGNGDGMITRLGTTGQVSASASTTPRRARWIPLAALAVLVAVATFVVMGTGPAKNPPVPAAAPAPAPAVQESQAPPSLPTSSEASPPTGARPLAAQAAPPDPVAPGHSAPSSQASQETARSNAASSPSSGSEQAVARSSAPGQATTSSSASAPAKRPDVRSAGTSRKMRLKTGKIEKPIAEPPTTPAPPDKPETWTPDVLLLKAPQ